MTWMIWGYPHFRKHIIKCPPHYQVNLFKSATTSHSSTPNSTCALMRWSTPWLYNQIGSFQPWHEGTGRHDEDHITDRNGRHVRRNPTFLQPIDSTRSNAIYLSNNDHRRTMEKRESDGRTLWRVGPLKIARWRSRTRPPQTSLESCQGLTRAGITGMINDQWPCNRDLN